METLFLRRRREVHAAWGRMVAQARSGMDYPALWRWILTIDDAGDETIPSSIGMRWIRQNPTAFAKLVGNVSWFLRASDIECRSGCLPDLAQWFFPDVLVSPHLLAFVPAADPDGARTRDHGEGESNEREELFEQLYGRYGATNSSWVGVMANLGISGDSFARALLERLVIEVAATDPAVSGAADILLAAGPADPHWLARRVLWEKVSDDSLAIALITCAQRYPARVLEVVSRAAMRFGQEVAQAIARHAFDHLDAVPLSERASRLARHAQRVSLANRLGPVPADHPDLGAATGRFLAETAASCLPEDQFNQWLAYERVLVDVNPTIVYRAARRSFPYEHPVCRRIRESLVLRGYLVGTIQPASHLTVEQPHVQTVNGTFVHDRRAHRYVPAPGDEVVYSINDVRVLACGIRSVRFIPVFADES